MFPSLPAAELGDEAIGALCRWLAEGDQPFVDDSGIPAGFTYLAQFVDHDITFDATSKIAQRNEVDELVNLRAARLNLECLYGAGPADQPFLYDWSASSAPGAAMLVGGDPRVDEGLYRDLPRNEQGRALVGDPRNDDHLIIAQLHLLFIDFHNAVVGELCNGWQSTVRELFDEARRIVRWHYQWIVAHEFLCHVVGPELQESVLEPAFPGQRSRIRREHYRWEREPFIPVEFSAAAYRFGHSMVRKDYGINDAVGRAVPIFATVGQNNHLAGFRRLPRELVIDWQRFFKLTDDEDPLRPQHSLRIDTAIVPALHNLPSLQVPQAGRDAMEDYKTLPWLDLNRGRALGLPSGQAIADAMGVTVLSGEQLRLEALDDPAAREALRRATPLWFYILCEAASEEFGDGGRHLGPVGGRIVAEVLVGLVEGDPDSYLYQCPTWRPELPAATQGDFTMADLVRFATRHE